MSAEAQFAPLERPIRITPPSAWFELNLAELWQYRELIYFFAWRDIKVRYKQTAIGAAWAILQPLLTMLVLTLFFGKLAKIPSGGVPYPIFYFSALLAWTYFAGALQNCTNVIVENQRMITKVYFPRLALPLSAVLPGLVDFAVAFVLLPGLMIEYRVRPGWSLLFLPAFLGLAVLTALGAGLWLSALNAIYRDVKYAVSFLVQFWFFASPVAYPSSLVHAKWRWAYGLNPMAGVIEGFRWSVTGKGPAPLYMIGCAVLVSLLLCLAGLSYFQKIETKIADIV